MKLKYAILDKLFELTNKEVDLLLYIARYQDDSGNVKGVYYRDVCDNCDMCKQTFYNSLDSMKRKGIIDYVRVENDYDITILGNDFSYPGSLSEGYVNVNKKVFDRKRFKALRAKEKVLLLYLLKLTHENASSYQIGTEKFYTKYTKLLGVTVRVLRGYLHSLRQFFSIGTKDGKCFITFLVDVFKDRREESEVDQYMGHVVRNGCRRNKVTTDSDIAVKDVIQLIKQYRQEAREADQNIFDILYTCLAKCSKGILNSKYIHKLIRQALGIENRPTMETQC